MTVKELNKLVNSVPESFEDCDVRIESSDEGWLDVTYYSVTGFLYKFDVRDKDGKSKPFIAISPL